MTKITATCIYLDNYRKTKNWLPKHISPTAGCFLYPILKMDIWETTRSFQPEECWIHVLLRCWGYTSQSKCKFHLRMEPHTINQPYHLYFLQLRLFLNSGATSLCDHQMDCPKLLSNWSEHIEDLIQAYELYFYGTKTYRWILLNSGNWQMPAA